MYTDLQILIEFCDRFGYEYDRIKETEDGGIWVETKFGDYIFDEDGNCID